MVAQVPRPVEAVGIAAVVLAVALRREAPEETDDAVAG